MSEPIHINRRRQAPVRNRRPAPTPKKHGLFGGSKKSAKRPAQKAVKKGGLFGKKKINKQPTNQSKDTDLAADNTGVVKNKDLLIRQQLTGPAKLIGDQELSMLVKMDTSVAYIQKRMKNRMMVSIICAVLGLVVGLVLKSNFGPLFGMGLALSGMTWYIDQKKTTDFYRQFQLKRQIAFSQFTRLAAAYLPELKEGTNLYSVFERIVPRMNDERDATALQKLMINMQADPEDSGPFLEFAHEFSVSDRAELIMLTIQQMYLGDVEDENIRSLADGANEDMLKQTDTIITYKLKRFNNLTARIGICAMIPIIGYFVLLVASTVGSALGQVTSQIGG